MNRLNSGLPSPPLLLSGKTKQQKETSAKTKSKNIEISLAALPRDIARHQESISTLRRRDAPVCAAITKASRATYGESATHTHTHHGTSVILAWAPRPIACGSQRFSTSGAIYVLALRVWVTRAHWKNRYIPRGFPSTGSSRTYRGRTLRFARVSRPEANENSPSRWLITLSLY